MKPIKTAVIILSTLWLTGCPNMVGEQGTPDPNSGSLLVNWGTDTPALTVLPTVDMRIASYDVSGSGPNGAGFSRSSVSGGSVQVDTLSLGEWTITVDARNAEGDIIGRGQAAATIAAGANTVRVTVKPLPGNGDIRLRLQWPTGELDSPAVSGTLLNSSGSQAVMSFAVGAASGQALYSQSKPAGYYIVQFRLTDHGTLKYAKALALRVVAGQTTEEMITLSTDELGEKEQAEPPTADITGGTFNSVQTVRLNTATAGAVIIYTTNGTLPSASNGTQISSGTAITIDRSLTLRAIAIKDGWHDSSLFDQSYSLLVENLTIDQPGGTFSSVQTVRLNMPTAGATIRYTTDGTLPTSTHGTPIASGAVISIDRNLTLKAVAVRDGWTDSNLISETYSFKTGIAIDKTGGLFNSVQTVRLSTPSAGALIRYTTDGSLPTSTHGTQTVSGATISIDRNLTLKAVAVRDGWSDSDLISETYSFQAGIAIDKTGGSFNSAQTLRLNTPTAGAAIRYTTDGTTPSGKNGIQIASGTAIVIDKTTTLKAVAFRDGWQDSGVLEHVYTIAGTIAAPLLSQTPGIHFDPITLILSSPTADTSIYYTTDGSNPDILRSNGQVYSTGIAIAADMTVKALAYSNSDVNKVSNIVSADYRITGYAEDPVVTLAGGNYTSEQTLELSSSGGAEIYYSSDGSDPATAGTLYSGAIAIDRSQTIKAVALKTDWGNSAVVEETYTLSVASPVFSPAAGSYNSEQDVELSTSTANAIIYYSSDGSTPDTSKTRYTGAIPVSQTTTIRAIAVREGWSDSPVVSGEFELKVHTPVFSELPGRYPQSVLAVIFECDTPGVSYYYTEDGSTPTPDGSSGTSRVLSQSTTLKVIAVKDGWADSEIAVGAYQMGSTEVSPPDSGSAGTTPLIQWPGMKGARSWQIQMAADAGFASPTADVDGLSEARYQVATALSDGRTYYWRVRPVLEGGAMGSWYPTYSFTARTSVDNIKEFNGHWYEFVSDKVNWTEAKTRAAAAAYDGMSGYLVTITSQEENDFIAGNISDSHWIGASDAQNEGQWIWETGPEAGSALDDGYTNWNSGEPNNRGSEHYGSIYGSSHNSSGRWNDTPVIDLPYIIEYSGSGTSEGDNLINYWLTLGVEDVSLQWLPDNTHKAVVVSDLQAGMDYSLGITGRPTGADPAAVSIDNTGVITVSETASAADGGLYSISAAGQGVYSGTVSASFRLTLSGVVSGLSPADGSTTSDTTPALSWDAVPGAAGYELRIADSHAGLASAPAINVAGTTHTPTSALTNLQTHYWQVRAKDGTGQYGAWSAGQSLKVEWGAVSGLSPASTTDTTPTLSWNAVSGADRYEVQLAGSQGGVEQTTPVHAAGTFYTPSTPLEDNRSYYWRVRAVNGDEQAGDWSTVASLWVGDVPMEGLLAYYPFDGNADDASGNGHHGNVYGPSLSADRLGNQNSAYEFDGNNDYIDIGDKILFGDGFAFSIWFKSYHTDSSYHGLIGDPSGNNSSRRSPGIWIVQKTQIHTGFSDGTWKNFTTGNIFNANEWTHLVVQYDADTSYDVYINGFLEYTSKQFTSRSIYQTPVKYIGMSEYDFSGKMDDIRIYSRALTPDEIDALYRGTGSSGAVLDAVTGLSPASTADTTPTLSWNAVSGADRYEVQLAASQGGVEQTTPVHAAGTFYTPSTPLEDNRSYYWRVRAVNNNGQAGDWSTVASLWVGDVPMEGLLAYYPFDGNADDASGNGHHGILGGEVGHNSPSLTADRFGNQNSAYMFDSYLELIKLPHSVLDGQSEFSVSFWMKTEGSVIQRGIITGAASNYRNNELLIYIADDGEMRPHIKTNSFDGTRRINDEIWHFIVITRDNNGLTKLYVDGVLDLSDTLSAGNLDIANGGLWLGNDQDTVGGSWASSQQFLGQLDEMRIYSRGLSENEIDVLYKSK